MHSPGPIPDVLTVHFYKLKKCFSCFFSLVALESQYTSTVTIPSEPYRGLGYFQSRILLRLSRCLESTLGQDPQPFWCGKSGPPDLEDILLTSIGGLWTHRACIGIPDNWNYD